MAARRAFPMLSCADLEASRRFYGELLGGRESYRFPEEGEPAFVALTLGDSEIGLGVLGDGDGAIHRRALRPATGHRIELCVYVDDVDATVAAMRSARVEVVVAPADMPWGERIAYVEDPDGNLVMLAVGAGS